MGACCDSGSLQYCTAYEYQILKHYFSQSEFDSSVGSWYGLDCGGGSCHENNSKVVFGRIRTLDSVSQVLIVFVMIEIPPITSCK